jgi:hypothetical protein
MDDIIIQEFRCLRCGSIMIEQIPKEDKHLVRDKEKIVRLHCPCGYYEDRIVKPEDFKKSA